MKKVYLLSFLLSFSALFAQQDIQFTQFTHNRAFFNPGYYAINGSICLTGFHRSQWVGFDNAPTTQNVNVEIPIKFLHGGLGLVVTNDQIGYFNLINAGLGYSYHADVAGGKLGIGVLFNFMNTGLSGAEWVTPDGNFFDGAIAAPNSSSLAFDMQFGIYYQSDTWWAGVSSNRLIGAQTNVPSVVVVPTSITNQRHYYVMGGYNWYIPGTNWALLPALNLRTDGAAPLTFDVNVNALYNNKLWAGVAYRNQDAIPLMLGYQVSPAFKLGYSYDIPMNDVGAGGSHEIFLNYCFKIEIPPREKGSYRNPRFL